MNQHLTMQFETIFSFTSSSCFFQPEPSNFPYWRTIHPALVIIVWLSLPTIRPAQLSISIVSGVPGDRFFLAAKQRVGPLFLEFSSQFHSKNA